MQPLSSVALVESNNTDRDETNAHSVKKMNRAVFSAPEPLILFLLAVLDMRRFDG
jgi:hypothetical protein